MKRRFFFLVSSIVTLSLIAGMVLVVSPSPAQAAGPSANVVGGCAGATITVSGLAPGTTVVAYVYNYAYKSSLHQWFLNQILADEYQFNTPNVAVFNSRWVQQAIGTPLTVEVAWSPFNFDPNGNFIPNFYSDFTCSTPGPGLPPHSVLAYFPAQTQVYATADTSHPVSGAVINAGQTWFVYELSANKQFYHVYLGGGTVGWVPVGSAQLQGALYNAATYCTSLTDNDDNCKSSTPPPVAYGGGSGSGGAVAVNYDHIPIPNH
ncbi:MAG: hypothetical protein ACYDBJ_05720 [Aggregatilineales bacterium]